LRLARKAYGLEVNRKMALTPFRIVVLLVSTFVLSILGIVLIVVGVHGPQVVAMIGGFFLLPSIILTRLGVPVGIPLIQSTSIISILAFVVLQTAYYYTIFQLVYFIKSRARGRSRAG
jgi:hypothetical protein